MASMAAAAKKLDIKAGDLVEIDGRKHDVFLDQQEASRRSGRSRGQSLTIHAARGARPVTPEAFEHYFGDLPLDGEGSRIGGDPGPPIGRGELAQLQRSAEVGDGQIKVGRTAEGVRPDR